MSLSPSPLERVPTSSGPRLHLKREDLLPFGGGSKVRRFLAALPRDSGDERKIAVLSERGAHTFLALLRMREEGALGGRNLLFWERAVPRNPYVEANRALYADRDHVVVREGPLPVLLLRMLATRVFRRRSVRVLGIGGTVAGGRAAHREAFEECLAQLGRAEGQVTHVVAAASGAMVDGFLDAIEARGLAGHRVLAVLTGPFLARVRLRLRWLLRGHVVLVPAPRLSWDEYRARATAFHDRTGVWLDPRHTIRAAAALDLVGEGTAILWVTCPRLAGLPRVG